MIACFYCLTHSNYEGKRVCDVLCLLCERSNKFSNALYPCYIFLINWVAIDLIIELQHTLRCLSVSIAIIEETGYAEVLYFFHSHKVVNVRHKYSEGFFLYNRGLSVFLWLSFALDVQNVAH